MKIQTPQFLIYILVLSLFSLGAGRAGAGFCAPDISHCPNMVVKSCCDEMAGDSGSMDMEANTSHTEAQPCCADNGAYCPASSGKTVAVTIDTQAQIELPSSQLISAFSTISKPGTVRPTVSSNHKPAAPPPCLYTLNCTFLI